MSLNIALSFGVSFLTLIPNKNKKKTQKPNYKTPVSLTFVRYHNEQVDIVLNL